ncbi:MAG: histidinol dehydrogenase, partial [Microvirga sp.]
MARRLDAHYPGFEPAFAALLAGKREVAEDVDGTVRDIIADVRARGDAAVIDYTRAFDALELTPQRLRVAAAEIDAAADACPPAALAALGLARERIEAYHRAQKPQDHATTDALGVSLGWRWTAIA